MDLPHNDGVMVGGTTQAISQPVEKTRSYYLYALVLILGIMLVMYLRSGNQMLNIFGAFGGILWPILGGALFIHFVTYLVKVPTRSFDKALLTNSILVALQMLSTYGLMSMRLMSQYLFLVPILVMLIAEWISIKTIYKATNKKTVYVILLSLLLALIGGAILIYAVLTAFRGSWS